MLGLVHEDWQERAPDKCAQKAVGPTGDTNLTKHDPNSVMSGCNPSYGNAGVLSALDIQAAQELYGAPKE